MTTAAIEKYPVAAGRCPCCGGTQRIWPPWMIVDAIRRWAHEHGAPPRFEDWSSPPRGYPSYTVVRDMFGSWNKGILAAGFEPRNHGQIWTKSEVVALIQQHAREHGDAPTSRDWQRKAPGRPHARGVARLFGSWNAALEAAGFWPRGAQGARYVDTDRTRRLEVRQPTMDELRAEAKRERNREMKRRWREANPERAAASDRRHAKRRKQRQKETAA